MCGFVSVHRCEEASLKRLILHLTKGTMLLDCGSSTSDLSAVVPCEVPWCSTMLKQSRLLMFEWSSCQWC